MSQILSIFEARLLKNGEKYDSSAVHFEQQFTPVFTCTIWLKSVTNFSVDMHLLHQYGNDISHLSDFDSLVIGLQKSEISAKNI